MPAEMIILLVLYESITGPDDYFLDKLKYKLFIVINCLKWTKG